MIAIGQSFTKLIESTGFKESSSKLEYLRWKAIEYPIVLNMKLELERSFKSDDDSASEFGV